MSSADRDWFREADAGPRGWGGTPACWSLIAINVLLWAVPPRLGAASLLDGFALRADDVVRGGRLYEIATYAFAPGQNSPWDLVWALACLLVFGREIEARAGTARFLGLYGVAVLAVGMLAVPWIAWVARGGSLAGGAGAAVAVLAAHVFSRPYATLLGVPVAAAAVLLVALPASQHLVISRDPAWAAHLAGAGVGVLFARRATGRWKRSVGVAAPAGPDGSGPAEDAAAGENAVARRVDSLLGKINREGLASLTDEERAFLRRASEQFRG